MKALYSILLTITTLSACAKKVPGNSAPTNMNNKDTTVNALNYLALGDSYTIGESVPQADSYPYQLVNVINADPFKINPPQIIATTGWTTDELINAIGNAGIREKQFAFVTLLIGVNDQYQKLSQDNYRVKFAEVLQTAISFVKGDASRVFVISIPDWGVTPYAGGQESVIGPEIDQFNAINKQLSLKAGVNYLDITPISKQAATDPSLIAFDGLHPSGKMYQEWVKLLAPMVKTRLSKN